MRKRRNNPVCIAVILAVVLPAAFSCSKRRKEHSQERSPATWFSKARLFETEPSASSVVVGDADGDRNPDLFVSHIRLNRWGKGMPKHEDLLVSGVTILLGNGKGAFTYSQLVTSGHVGGGEVPLHTRSRAVILDLNGDSQTDLITSSFVEGFIGISLGLGAATYRPRIDVPVGKGPNGVAVFHDIGKNRTIIASPDRFDDSVTLHVFGRSEKPLETMKIRGIRRPESVALADFDGNGLVDGATISQETNLLTVFRQEKKGVFSLHTFSPAPQPSALAVEDLNGDRRPDLVVGFAGAPFQSKYGMAILFGDGHGKFASPTLFTNSPSPVTGVATGDINRDGYPDVAACGWNGELAFLLGQKGGTFQEAVGTLPTGAQEATDVALADLNKDGKMDLVVTHQGREGFVSLLLHNP